MHPGIGTVASLRIAMAALGIVAFTRPLASPESLASHGGKALPVVVPNPNTTPAGELRDGVLTVTLEARLGMWHPNGDSLPGIPIEVFGEAGRAPRAAGPLLRMPLGTEIRALVRNSLERDSLLFYVHVGDAVDSVAVAPGATGALRVRPARAGNFLYRATTTKPLNRPMRFGGLLAGALIVDSAGVTGTPRDRVFVLQVATDSLIPGTNIPLPERSVWAINGRSWPHTERFTATVGDTLRWRWINGTDDGHPMHLHGFYFRVDDFDGPTETKQGKGAQGRQVVTERMAQLNTMAVTWIPERPGNWLFHCHFQEHVLPHGPLSPNGDAPRIGSWHDRHPAHHGNHAETGMAGLVVAITVRPRDGERAAAPDAPRRRLRLIAIQDMAADTSPMRFLLEERGRTRSPVDTRSNASPTIELTRGEPVSITVVNRMREATSVHWHGMELESYFDGVAGFSGSGRRLAPIIAPRDSFEALFTPPRAGTFIYHSHVDEVRQHRAGLLGAMIVREPGGPPPGEHESILVIKSTRRRAPPIRVEINGSLNPDTLVLPAGVPHRLRFIAMQTGFPNATVTVTSRRDSAFANLRDTMLVRWRPVAKDGADLPDAERVPGPARQSMGMGETFDFELTPERAGVLRIEVRNARGLLARVPILVR